MRIAWLLIMLAACTRTPKEGEKVVVGDGDDVVVGSVRIEVVSHDDVLYLRMSEGASTSTRRVAGLRDVKFAAHRVKFEEIGSQVSIVVRSYKPSSPLTSVDAIFAADERMSVHTVGMSDCTTATLSADGKSYVVTCSDTDVANSARPITVDAVTGAVSM